MWYTLSNILPAVYTVPRLIHGIYRGSYTEWMYISRNCIYASLLCGSHPSSGILQTEHQSLYIGYSFHSLSFSLSLSLCHILYIFLRREPWEMRHWSLWYGTAPIELTLDRRPPNTLFRFDDRIEDSKNISSSSMYSRLRFNCSSLFFASSSEESSSSEDDIAIYNNEKIPERRW